MSLLSLAVLAVVVLTVAALGLLLWPTGGEEAEVVGGTQEAALLSPDEGDDEGDVVGEAEQPPQPPNPGGSTSEAG